MGQTEQQQKQQRQQARAQQTAKGPPPPQQEREVQTGDFIFLIRKDVRRYKRMKVRALYTRRIIAHTRYGSV